MGANRKRFWMRAKRNKWRERKRVTLFAFAWTCTPFLLVKTPSVLAKSHQKKAQFCRFGKGKIQETKKLKSRGKVYKTFTRIICKCGHCFQTMATHVIYACKSLIKLAPARGMIANTRFTQDPCSNFPLGRGGGWGWYSWEFLVEVCRPVLQILTLFQTKKCHFSHLFSDLACKIHTRFRTWHLINYLDT